MTNEEWDGRFLFFEFRVTGISEENKQAENKSLKQRKRGEKEKRRQ